MAQMILNNLRTGIVRRVTDINSAAAMAERRCGRLKCGKQCCVDIWRGWPFSAQSRQGVFNAASWQGASASGRGGTQVVRAALFYRYCLPVRELSHRDGARSADAVTPPSAVRHVQLTKHCTGGYTTVYDDLITSWRSEPNPYRCRTRAHTRRYLSGGSSPRALQHTAAQRVTCPSTASDMPFHSE